MAAGGCTLVNVFGVTGLQVAACHKGAQDAFAHIGLHGSDGAFIETSCRVKNHTLRCRAWLWVGLCRSIHIDALRHWSDNSLKHPIDHTDMKTSEAQFREPQAKGLRPAKAHACSGWSHNEVAVQTNLYSSYVGTKAVDEGDRAQVPAGGVSQSRTGAMGQQALLHHVQKDAQRRIECTLVALQVIAQPFGRRQHPLAHWQAGADVIGQVRCGLGHAPGVTRGADATAFAGEGDQKIVTAVIATYPRKPVGKVGLS